MEEYVTEFNWDDVDECGCPWFLTRERVVRCSGCIYATEGYDGGLWCGGFDCSTEPDGFCKWGERR